MTHGQNEPFEQIQENNIMQLLDDLLGIDILVSTCDILPLQVVPYALVVGSLLDLDHTIPFKERTIRPKKA